MADLIDPIKLKQIVEAALMAADAPLSVDQLQKLFAHGELDSEEGRAQIRDTLKTLEEEAAGRGYELVRVASGYRYQVRQELSPWVSRLWEEKPPRYSRALLETLALIAYKQPVTRGDIEQVRGVAVSQNIMRTLMERNWIRVVGQREVPGRPSLYGTTREFLDYFGLKSLDQLPPLAEIRSLIEPLALDGVDEDGAGAPDQQGTNETEPSADARSEEVESREGEEAVESAGEGAGALGEGSEAEAAGPDDRTRERQEHEASGEGPGERPAERPHSAEVVRLPTSPRR
ncbi:MAG TPA: SMC-Scp complex subunit ScpB [Pseudomonadales bacterium]